MNFQNNPIDITLLPQSNSISFVPLLKRYRKLLNIQWIIFFSILLSSGIAFYLLNDIEPIWLFYFIAFFAIWVLVKFILIQVGFRHKGYALRDLDIHYKTGYIIRKITTVPINRIQHMEIRQGMISRILKLAKLKIFTAGDSSSDLSLKGISPENAHQLKELLTEIINQNGQN